MLSARKNSPWVKLSLASLSQQTARLGREIQEFRDADVDKKSLYGRELMQAFACLKLALPPDGNANADGVLIFTMEICRELAVFQKLSPTRVNQVFSALRNLVFFGIEGKDMEVMTVTPANLLILSQAYAFMITLYKKKSWECLWLGPGETLVLNSMVALVGEISPDHHGSIRASLEQILKKARVVDPKVDAADFSGLCNRKLPIEKQSSDDGIMVKYSPEDIKMVHTLTKLLGVLQNQEP